MFKYHNDFDETPADLLYLRYFVQHLCVFAAFTWLVYEYCITLDKEIEFFWGRRPNGGSLLFFLSRYLPLLVKSLGISGYAVTNDQGKLMKLMIDSSISCYRLTLAFQVLGSLQYLPSAAFSGMRAWVLGGQNWVLTTFVTILGLVPVGLAYSQVSSIEVRVHPSFGCFTGVVSVTSFEEERVCLITSHAIVLVVTWLATYNMGVLRCTPQWKYNSFGKTLFRDGTIYFCALLILNVLDLVFSLRMIKNPVLNPSCHLVIFIGPAATTLVNRFLIHIQEANKRMTEGLDSSKGASMQTNDRSFELRFIKTSP